MYELGKISVTFRKKALLVTSIIMVLAYVFGIRYMYRLPYELNNSVFRDMTDNWARYDAEYMFNNGYMKGLDEGGFYPNRPITRAELTMIFLRFAEGTTKANKLYDVAAETPYKDVPPVHWAASVINEADKLHLNLFPDAAKSDMYQPSQPVTRIEMVNAIINYFKLPLAKTRAQFSDLSALSSEQSRALETMVERGYINGFPDGTFRPNQQIDRASTAHVLTLALKDLAAQKQKDAKGAIQ